MLRNFLLGIDRISRLSVVTATLSVRLSRAVTMRVAAAGQRIWIGFWGDKRQALRHFTFPLDLRIDRFQVKFVVRQVMLGECHRFADRT